MAIRESKRIPGPARQVVSAGDLLLALALCGAVLAGCSLPIPFTRTPPPPTAEETQQVPQPSPRPTETPAVLSTPTVAEPLTVTIWTAPYFAPGVESEAQRLLAAHSKSFAEQHSEYALDWVVKPASGPGSLVEFMRSAQEVAPAILPDLAVIRLEDLPAVSQAGLLQPMDELLAEDARADLFPFARSAAQIENQWYGVPFAADIEHLIYNTTRVDAPPLTWSDVLSDSIPYAFPAGGRDGGVNDAFLIQYLALGGRLSNERGLPVLDPEPLAQVLSFYESLRRQGLSPAGILELRTAEEALSVYIGGDADICNVRSDLYLAHRSELRNTSFATIPTWNGSVATVGRPLAFVLLATDPPRQAAAERLVTWFIEPERNVAWTRAAGHLPVRDSLMDMWSSDDNYANFARWQLESAFHVPAGPVYVRIYAALQQAVREVLIGSATPGDAARRAASVAQGEG